MAEINLYYTSGSSDKEYNLILSGTPGEDNWGVYFTYGRRGNAGNSGYKITGATEARARREFEKYIRQKVGKGYTTEYSGNPGTVTIEQAIAQAYGNDEEETPAPQTRHRPNPAGRAERLAQRTQSAPAPAEDDFEEQAPRRVLWSGRARATQAEAGDAATGVVVPGLTDTLLSQQPNPIDDPFVYINDELFGMQDKYDGKHVMVRVLNGEAQAFNKKGQPIVIPQTVIDSVKQAGIDLEIDGELIGQRYVVYDILMREGYDLRKDSYRVRHSKIPRQFQPRHFGNAVEIAPLYVGTSAKSIRYDEIDQANGEGVVFKRLDSTFAPGRPSSGGDFLKFKFYATCSCVATEGRRGRRSVGLTLVDLGSDFRPTYIPVGNVTIPVNKDVPMPGDVVEVKYLYAYEGGSLYQPIYIGPRDDVDPEECSITQLKYKPEA